MTHTETSPVPAPQPNLILTVPSDAAPAGGHAVVLHTPVEGGPTAEPITTALPATVGPVTPAMPDLPVSHAVQVSSRENP
jgi:hypothetical protein